MVRRTLANPMPMPLYSCVTDENEWDAYEESHHANVGRYFNAHPADPDRAAMLERIASWNRHYHLCGRETLGFGLYLFNRVGLDSLQQSAVRPLVEGDDP
jgi:hypothetical protein